jgi:hypothetical protein
MASLPRIFDSFFERKDKLKWKNISLIFHKLVKLNAVTLNSKKVSIHSVPRQYTNNGLDDFTLTEIIKRKKANNSPHGP